METKTATVCGCTGTERDGPAGRWAEVQSAGGTEEAPGLGGASPTAS